MIQSSLTEDQVLAAIKALAAFDLDVTHGNIRNQLISNGFRPTGDDLVIRDNSFLWLRHLSKILAGLRSQGIIETCNEVGRKGTKYRLVVVEQPQPQPEPNQPRQITLPEYSSGEQLAAIASDLAEIKALLRELVEVVKDDPQTYPNLEFPVNGNGNHAEIVPSAPQNRG